MESRHLRVRASRLGNPRSNMYPDVTARPQLQVTDGFAEAPPSITAVLVQVSMGVVLVTTDFSTPFMKLANGFLTLVGQNPAHSSYVRRARITAS
jgi:hypothetical protein